MYCFCCRARFDFLLKSQELNIRVLISLQIAGVAASSVETIFVVAFGLVISHT